MKMVRKSRSNLRMERNYKMSKNLKFFMSEELPKIEKELLNLVQRIDAPKQLKESMMYSLKQVENEFDHFLC